MRTLRALQARAKRSAAGETDSCSASAGGVASRVLGITTPRCSQRHCGRAAPGKEICVDVWDLTQGPGIGEHSGEFGSQEAFDHFR
jgi:hypothetical protein